jgi:hypothetical protein
LVSRSKGRTLIEGVLEQGAEEVRDEVAGGWRRLHNEELHNLSASPNIVMVIKSRCGDRGIRIVPP